MSSSGRFGTSGSQRRRWVVSAGAAIVVVLVVVLIIVLASGGTKTHTGTAPPSTTVVVPTGSGFAVSGDRILGPHSQPFVPYGIVVFGLAGPQWSSSVHGDLAKIRAIAKGWHGNTVRLQVAPNYLVAGANTHAFEAALKKEVAYAQSLHLVVIIACQTEHSESLPMPNASVTQFWTIVAPLYAHDPDVWFDLFNEPRLKSSGGDGAIWKIWQNGGDGYVGMQSLVTTIRASASNIILAEGIHFARTLNDLKQHMLTGSNIVYEVHAFFVRPNHLTPADWTADWGDLSSTVPILIGAWSQYENGHGDCVSNAATLVPTFLGYVKAHDVGLIGWSLTAGVLIQGNDLYKATTINSSYNCSNQDDKSDPQGAGAALMSFFAANSKPVPTAG